MIFADNSVFGSTKTHYRINTTYYNFYTFLNLNADSVFYFIW